MPLTDNSVPLGSELTTTWHEERLEVDTMTNTYHARCRPDEAVSTAVVLTVAAIHDCDPVDLPPLLSAVDPDVLVQLVTHDSPSDVMMRFVYADSTVTVQSTGDITVAPTQAD